ncbi:hypothetical protein K438DRAFT_1779541 [Mycena galopus ATCC 62051]|nr:hypothetical protein K438DRAFT_1779541 [Mycena galopus ATCC 62051]
MSDAPRHYLRSNAWDSTAARRRERALAPQLNRNNFTFDRLRTSPRQRKREKKTRRGVYRRALKRRRYLSRYELETKWELKISSSKNLRPRQAIWDREKTHKWLGIVGPGLSDGKPEPKWRGCREILRQSERWKRLRQML